MEEFQPVEEISNLIKKLKLSRGKIQEMREAESILKVEIFTARLERRPEHKIPERVFFDDDTLNLMDERTLKGMLRLVDEDIKNGKQHLATQEAILNAVKTF